MKIERILAPNPGPFTGPGTNSWLLESQGEAVVIDPGPVEASHFDAIVDAIGDLGLAGVLVTHTHSDHAPLANPLAREYEVAAFGYEPGPQFDPDVRLQEGSGPEVGSLRLRVVHTPGHSDDHLCFLAGRVLFTGDHIMGGSSVMIEKLGPYLDSLRKLQGLELDQLYPGHGEVMDDPNAVIDWYVAHRLERQAQIVAAIQRGASSVAEIVDVVYREVDPSLHPLAARSVTAHVEKLATDGVVAVDSRRIAMRDT